MWGRSPGTLRRIRLEADCVRGKAVKKLRRIRWTRGRPGSSLPGEGPWQRLGPKAAAPGQRNASAGEKGGKTPKNKRKHERCCAALKHLINLPDQQPCSGVGAGVGGSETIFDSGLVSDFSLDSICGSFSGGTKLHLRIRSGGGGGLTPAPPHPRSAPTTAWSCLASSSLYLCRAFLPSTAINFPPESVRVLRPEGATAVRLFGKAYPRACVPAHG